MFRRSEGWVLLVLGLLRAVLGSFAPLCLHAEAGLRRVPSSDMASVRSGAGT